MSATRNGPLNILHVFRAPVGGLFRHVIDLARGQIARGHNVGLIADSTTGGARADAALAELAGDLKLGIFRIPVRRHLGPRDFGAVWQVSRHIAEARAHVIHGHGAKGGAYARLASRPASAIRAYTPHGGSLLYRPNALLGMLYLRLEAALMRRGDLFLFESAYSAEIFRAKVGDPKGIVRVVHNGIGAGDFEPLKTSPDATDIVFVGEFRPVKGIDVLIESIGLLHREGRRITATIVGHGPEEPALRALAARLRLADHIHFRPAMPARQAFSLGSVMLVPSRSESLPYIVLEAAGAGIPLIATSVGGIPEIFGPQADRLVPPENPGALGAAIANALDHPEAMRDTAAGLRKRVKTAFSVEAMVDRVLLSYQEALAA